MKVLIIDNSLKLNTTGGQWYNSLFYKEILKFDNIEVLTDNIVGVYNIPILYNLIYLFYIKKILKSDVIITGSSLFPRIVFLIILLKLIKPKLYIITIHHHYVYQTKKNYFIRTITKILEIAFLKSNDEVIVPSEFTLKITSKIVPRKKITFIPLGFKLNTSFHKKDNSIRKKTRLLYVGSITERKGLLYLIDALSEIPNEFILNFVGAYNKNDKYYKKLVSLIENYHLNDKVIFNGKVESDKLKQFYMESDIFVFPSLYEGFGMVIAEAFTYGLPVVAFNNSAISLMVSHEYNGLLAKDKSVIEFRKNLETLLNNKGLVKQMSIHAFEKAAGLNKYETMLNDMKSWVNDKLINYR